MVIGSGLTAGQTALAAVARGAAVTLVSRSRLRRQVFDVQGGWLTPTELRGYYAEPAAHRRVDQRTMLDQRTMKAQRIWLATGTAPRLDTGSLLAQVVASRPAEVAGARQCVPLAWYWDGCGANRCLCRAARPLSIRSTDKTDTAVCPVEGTGSHLTQKFCRPGGRPESPRQRCA